MASLLLLEVKRCGFVRVEVVQRERLHYKSFLWVGRGF